MPRGSYTPTVVVDTAGLSEEEWLEYRRGGIGGSDVSIIYGLSHFRTCRELYYDKIEAKKVNEHEDTSWLQKKMGHVLEDLVAEVFMRKTCIEVFQDKKMYSHPKYPFMIADVDYFVRERSGKNGLLECKTTNYQNRDAWEDGKFPYQYELQVRHYLAVMNLDFAYIACLWGNSENDFAWRRIERDYDFEDQIIEMEQNFWEEYVLKRVEPPFTEKPDMVLECLSTYIGNGDVSKGRMSLSTIFSPNIEEYLKLKAKKSELESEARMLDAEIKKLYAPVVEELGVFCESEIEISGTKYLITSKPKYDTRIRKDELDKLRVNYPDIYSEYTTTKESRTFSVKEMKVS